MTEWYYVDNLRQRQGPVPQEALVKLHRSGALNDASLAWREGMGQWTPLGELGSELGAPDSRARGRTSGRTATDRTCGVHGQ